MNKKAFTLIELLGVIVILSIVALLAFPPLLNQIKNSENKINDAAKTIIVNSAQLYVNDNTEAFSKVNGNIYCLNFDDLLSKGYLKKDLINDADKIFNTMSIKINYSNNYTYDVVPNGQCEKTTLCSIISGDVNTVGSEVECGGERFYIINQDTTNHNADETTVTLLAKYNLNVGTNRYPNEKTYGLQDSHVLGYYSSQSNTNYGVVPFSGEVYWESESYPTFIYNENSNLYTYINNYKLSLENMGIKNINAATLMSYEQASNKTYFNSSYWLGSASSEDSVYAALSYGSVQSPMNSESSTYGVRPIIIISKDSFQK